MKNTVFLDTQLPYGEGIPATEVLKKYPQVQFPIINGSRRLDMILGAPHIHQFGLFFDSTWTETKPNEPTIGYHELGSIWWGLKRDDSTTTHIRLVKGKFCSSKGKGRRNPQRTKTYWNKKENMQRVNRSTKITTRDEDSWIRRPADENGVFRMGEQQLNPKL